jgi:8-oxo-dGTP diphosphatase
VTDARKPAGYDPTAFPPFAVTVDVVVLTVLEGELHVLLVRRGGAPYAGRWALPGGFKRPDETLDQAANRELREETGVEAAARLEQFGAYGDPGRDPRMDVVTVGYLAVLRDVSGISAGTDASDARLFPVAKVLGGRMRLAFDHRRILGDAVERARQDLETTSLATAFVGPRFTLSELQDVYEALWETRLDRANFRRSLTRESGWVRPTRVQKLSSPSGGRPAELFEPGSEWALELRAPPIRRPRSRPPELRGAEASGADDSTTPPTERDDEGDED